MPGAAKTIEKLAEGWQKNMGEANELTLMATLAGCEMGLKLSGVTLAGSGVIAAMEHLTAQQPILKMA